MHGGRAALLAWVCAMGGACGAAVAVPATDGFAGAWTLQRERCDYQGQPVPLGMTLAIDAVAAGLHYRSNTEQNGGRTSSAEFTAGFDGTLALVAGGGGFLAPVALRRVDDLTIDATYTSGLKKIAWSRWVLSADKAELTVTTTYLAPDGAARVNVARFARGAGADHAAAAAP